MPANFAELNAAIVALTTQVTATEGVTDSAVALIDGFAAQVTKAVTDALTADDAADNGSISAANSAIADVLGRFKAAGDRLGVAVAAHSTPPVA